MLVHLAECRVSAWKGIQLSRINDEEDALLRSLSKKQAPSIVATITVSRSRRRASMVGVSHIVGEVIVIDFNSCSNLLRVFKATGVSPHAVVHAVI